MVETKELLAFIRVREAIGDENGRLMQDEVVDRVRMLVKENVELKKMRNGLQARNTELVLKNRELKAKFQYVRWWWAVMSMCNCPATRRGLLAELKGLLPEVFGDIEVEYPEGT